MDATQQRLETRIIIPGATAVPGHPIGTYWVHSKVPGKPVFFGRHQKTGIEHAIKREGDVNQSEAEHFGETPKTIATMLIRYEHMVHSRLDHPNIAKPHLFGHNGKWHMATPYSGITLDTFATDQAARKLDYVREDNERLRVLYQIARALAYCHARGVAHLDVKPRNIVVDDNCKATVIDFGSAREVRKDLTQVIRDMKSFTDTHAAKEQLNGKYSDKSDVFSYAIIAYELMTALDAFKRNEQETIDHNEPKYDIRQISQYGTIAYLIIDALNNDPTKRPEMQRMADALERMV